MSPIDQHLTGMVDVPNGNLTAAELRAKAIAEGLLPGQEGMSVLEQPITPDTPES